MNENTAPSEQMLDDLVRRIVEAAHPLRIILFGSAGRGEMGPSSDLDLLVVISSQADFVDTEDRIWRSLRGLGRAKDIVVVTERDFTAQASNPCLVVYHALREGRVLYHAA